MSEGTVPHEAALSNVIDKVIVKVEMKINIVNIATGKSTMGTNWDNFLLFPVCNFSNNIQISDRYFHVSQALVTHVPAVAPFTNMDWI